MEITGGAMLQGFNFLSFERGLLDLQINLPRKPVRFPGNIPHPVNPECSGCLEVAVDQL